MRIQPAQPASLVAMAGLSTIIVLLSPGPALAMHIAEGFLPFPWAAFWWLVSLPFLLVGLRSLARITREHPELKLLLGLAGAFTFVLSALKIPSVTGSCSHPTGTGLGAILFGPSVMAVLGGIELLFQAVFQGWGSVVISGITFTRMIQHYGPVRSTMITALVPGLSAFGAVVFLGEPLQWNLLAGLALVTLGILFGVRIQRKAAA